MTTYCTDTNVPKVGIILLWYPLFTQPFIYRDVEALKNRLSARVYTLYGENLRLCSKEMRKGGAEALRLGTRALPSILLSNLRLLFRHPARYWRLFCEHVVRPWDTLEILGENLWAFLCGVHLAPIMKRDGIDIVYAPWPRGTATAARVVKQLEGIGYVVVARADNLGPVDADLPAKLREAAAIRSNNLSDGARIVALLEKCWPEEARAGTLPRVSVVYNCLTLHMDRPAALRFEKPVRILAAGRFDITKGFDILLRACALLRDRNVSFTLTLVGGGGKLMGLGDLEGTLHALCRDLGLEKIVSFPGLVSHDAFPSLLQEHDIFAAPCVVAPDGKRDGIPNTLIEAMSFGLPVVASAVSGLPEIVHDGETGLLVPGGDPEALASALGRLCENPPLARELARKGMELARSLFSPEKNGDLFARIFVESCHKDGAVKQCVD